MDIARGRRFALPAFAAAVVAATLIGSTGAASAALPHRPSPPVDLGMEGWGPNGSNALPCRAGDSRPAVGTRTPRLRARVFDQDDDVMSVEFTLHQGETEVTTLTTTVIPSGEFAEVEVPQGVLAENGVYSWSVRASDGKFQSERVGNCEFQVDSVPPNTPSVSSTDYPSTGFHGAPGRTGIFTFSPNGSTDVVRYAWSLNTDSLHNQVAVTDPSGVVNVPITPNSSGTNTLYVAAYDKAGNRSRTRATYDFRVAGSSEPPVRVAPVAAWNFDETAGTIAADTTGNGHSLTLDGASFSPGYAGNGQSNTTSSFSSTSSALVDTSRAFSVSAWVKLDDVSVSRAIASQDGTSASAFSLQYNDNRWSFTATSADIDAPATSRATSVGAPELGVWTHLVGAYESNKISLYVNGKLEGTADATLWNATGSFVVGAAKRAGVRADQLPGTIDHVQVWERALSAPEVARHSNLGALRAHYHLDEPEGLITKDEVTGQHATVSSGTTWRRTLADPDDPNQVWTSTDKWLRFGSSRTGLLTAPHPALRTDRSYTISAWVRRAGDAAGTVMSLGDAPFSLGYQPESGRWAFQLAETPSGTTTTVLSTSYSDKNYWDHLAVTFDAATGTITFYVDGIKQTASAGPGLKTFNGTGDLLVGSGWVGDVDDVRLFSGALSADEVLRLRLTTMHH